LERRDNELFESEMNNKTMQYHVLKCVDCNLKYLNIYFCTMYCYKKKINEQLCYNASFFFKVKFQFNALL